MTLNTAELFNHINLEILVNSPNDILLFGKTSSLGTCY